MEAGLLPSALQPHIQGYGSAPYPSLARMMGLEEPKHIKKSTHKGILKMQIIYFFLFCCFPASAKHEEH